MSSSVDLVFERYFSIRKQLLNILMNVVDRCHGTRCVCSRQRARERRWKDVSEGGVTWWLWSGAARLILWWAWHTSAAISLQSVIAATLTYWTTDTGRPSLMTKTTMMTLMMMMLMMMSRMRLLLLLLLVVVVVLDRHLCRVCVDEWSWAADI